LPFFLNQNFFHHLQQNLALNQIHKLV